MDQHDGISTYACKALGACARGLPPFKGKCRAGRNLASLLFRFGHARRVQVKMHDGSVLWLDPRGRTEAGAYFNGIHDADDIAFFKCCVDPDATVFDIGANIGLIAIPVARHLGAGGRIVAIEPVASNASALRNNFSSNPLAARWEVIECALGATEGTLRIGREADDGATTGNAFTEDSAAQINMALDWSVVPVKRLDDMVNELQLSRLDLIKMDVEGAEVDVLRGARAALEKHRPIIYGEFQLTLRPNSGDTFATVGSVLSGLDYRPFQFVDRMKLVKVEYAPGIGNAVLCPAEKVEQLLSRCERALRPSR